MIALEEIKHFGPENFCDLVDKPSTRRSTETKRDSVGRIVERTTFYKGSRVLGMQVRDANGYRYYIRRRISR